MTKKRYCIHGHDTLITGRRKISYGCIACYEERRKEYDKRYHEKRINNPIKRMRKNAMQRIRRFEKGK
jgi:hypothetical protein